MEQPSTIQYPKGDLPASTRPGQRARRVGQVQVSRNGRGGKREAAPGRYSDEADARYAAALKLVQAIDHNLQKGTRHYYDTQGRLLNTLDEVIHAMLADSLVLGGPDGYLQSDESMEWASIGEMAA